MGNSLQIPLGDLARQIGAEIGAGDPALPVSGVANLADAGPTQLAPFTDERYLPQLEKTRAGAVLAKSASAAARLPAGAALLCAADPEIAFLEAIRLFHPAPAEPAGIDARAAIDAGAQIGPDVHVGAFAVIRAGARIGARSVVHPHAVIGRDCELGEGCVIHPHVVLYERVKLGPRTTVHAGTVLGADGFGYKFRGGRHVKVPQVGTVEIGPDVEIGANACIDRGALDATRIGEGTKIDNLAQIGHGARVGRHCILCGQAAIAGSSGMDDYAVLGGNAGIADHVFMGKGSKAGAKTGVSKDTPPGQEIFGIIGEERRQALRQLAAIRRLPDLLERVRALEKKLGK